MYEVTYRRRWMADEQLNLILRLKDEATSQLSSIRNQVTAAAAAMAAGGLAMGAAWEASRDKIIAASGATATSWRVCRLTLGRSPRAAGDSKSRRQRS